MIGPCGCGGSWICCGGAAGVGDSEAGGVSSNISTHDLDLSAVSGPTCGLEGCLGAGVG